MFRKSFKLFVFAACWLGFVALLSSGCRRAGPTGSGVPVRTLPGFVTEADDGPQPQNRFGPPTDFLERHSRLLAGPSGIDCGRVSRMADPASATECALRAQAKGKPFRVRYDEMGADSVVAVAMVRTPAGSLSVLNYDSDPSGGGRQLHGLIRPTPCPDPVHLWVNRRGRVDCFHNGLRDPTTE
jgi:hypothetical protein